MTNFDHALVPVKAPSGDHSGYAWMGYIAISLAIAFFAVFASRAPLDSAAIAPGRVAAESSTKPVQHLEGGIIREVLVRESMRVKEGQVLFKLEPTVARANKDIIKKQLLADAAMEARLIAERDLSVEIALPADVRSSATSPDLTAIIEDEKRRFRERRQTIDNDTEILRKRLAQTSSEITGLQRQQTALEEQITSVQADVENFTKLFERGLYQKSRLNALKREQSRLEGELGGLQASMAKSEKVREETQLQIRQAQQKYIDEAAKQLPEVRGRIAAARERLAVAEDVMGRIEIKAPQDGAIQAIKVHAAGAVVRPGETLAELVPTGDKLVMSVRVSPLDVDNVQAKQTAEVRFPGFASRGIRTILGVVETIGADVQFDEYTKEPYYLGRVLVDATTVPKEVQERLVPGMPADVLITTGKRTLLQYLLGPVSDLVAKSMREQ